MVLTHFIGNKKAEDYTEIVKNCLSADEKVRCNISLKIHFLHSHLECFRGENYGGVSDEHANIEKKYQDKWNPGMLLLGCFFGDEPGVVYKK